MTTQPHSLLQQAHVTFIGGGNMGRALIGGLLTSGLPANRITVVEPFAATASKLKTDFKITILDSIDALTPDPASEQIVVLAIKPRTLNALRALWPRV